MSPQSSKGMSWHTAASPSVSLGQQYPLATEEDECVEVECEVEAAEDVEGADEDLAEDVEGAEEDFAEEVEGAEEDLAEDDFAEDVEGADEDLAEDVEGAEEEFLEEDAVVHGVPAQAGLLESVPLSHVTPFWNCVQEPLLQQYCTTGAEEDFAELLDDEFFEDELGADELAAAELC